MKTSMTALALLLIAPAAFAQKKEAKADIVQDSARGQIKVLRGEIRRDLGDMAAKGKKEREEKRALAEQEAAEARKLKSGGGTRAERKLARRALRQKYAKRMKDARDQRRSERHWLDEDVKSKRAQIGKLRQR